MKWVGRAKPGSCEQRLCMHCHLTGAQQGDPDLGRVTPKNLLLAMGQFSSWNLILSHHLERLVSNQNPRETFSIFSSDSPLFTSFLFFFFPSPIILSGISYRKIACWEGWVFSLKQNYLANILSSKVNHLTTRCFCRRITQQEAEERNSLTLSCSGTKARLLGCHGLGLDWRLDEQQILSIIQSPSQKGSERE